MADRAPTQQRPRLERFSNGQRVHVVCDYREIPIGAPGTVVRLRTADDAAWICLDARHRNDKVHPFPPDDSRANHVMCWPDQCERALPDAKKAKP